jgi:hypothetical protein
MAIPFGMIGEFNPKEATTKVLRSLGAFPEAMAQFVRYQDRERYHEAVGDVAPADVHCRRRDALLARQEEVRRHSIASRKAANLVIT